MYIPASYKSAVCWENTSRVFSNYLEFAVKYDGNPITNTSFKLVRNWAAGLVSCFYMMKQVVDEVHRGQIGGSVLLVGMALHPFQLLHIQSNNI